MPHPPALGRRSLGEDGAGLNAGLAADMIPPRATGRHRHPRQPLTALERPAYLARTVKGLSLWPPCGHRVLRGGLRVFMVNSFAQTSCLVDKFHKEHAMVRRLVLSAAILLAAGAATGAQGPGGQPPPNSQKITAIRAGRLIDPEAGTAAANQIIVVEGERIRNVGPNVSIPPNADVIDL